MSEGFNLPEDKGCYSDGNMFYWINNKEQENRFEWHCLHDLRKRRQKEHERQNLWSFAACRKILYASDCNPPCRRSAAWYRQFLHKWNNHRNLWITENPWKTEDITWTPISLNARTATAELPNLDIEKIAYVHGKSTKDLQVSPAVQKGEIITYTINITNKFFKAIN